MADMDIIYGKNHVRIRSEKVDIATITTEIEDLMRELETEMKTGNRDGIRLLRDVLDQKRDEASRLLDSLEDEDDGVDATASDDTDVADQKPAISAAQAAADTIKGFLDSRKAFCALNVTRAVQALGVRVRHRDLKEVVHNAFAAGEMGDYLRELFQLSGMPVPANLYYPPEFDTDDYDGEAVSAQVVDADDVDDDVAQDDSDDGNDSVDTAKFDTVRKMSQDGQLYLPKNMTGGLSNPVASVATYGVLIIGEASDAPRNHVPLTRDAKGQIRLTRKKIKGLGQYALGTATRFGITETDGELTVESAT